MIDPNSLFRKGLIDDPELIFSGDRSFSLLKFSENKNIINDRIIEQEVYGNTNSNDAYRKLKSRYNKKLLDEIYHGTYEKFNTGNRNSVITYLFKQYSIAFALKHEHYIKAYINIMQDVYKKAKKFEVPQIIELVCKELFYYYAFVNPDNKKMLFYDDERSKAVEGIIASYKMTKLNGELSNIYMNEKMNPSPKSKLTIGKKTQEIIELQNQTDDYTTHSIAYDLRVYDLIIKKQYTEILSLCDEAEAYYNEKNFKDQPFQWTVEFSRMNAFMLLKETSKALKQIAITESWLTKGSRYWFYIKHYEFLCYALDLNIEGSILVLAEALSNPNIKIYEAENNIWEARLILLTLLNEDNHRKLKTLGFENTLTTQRFLRKHKSLLKDKQAMNLTYRIVEIVYALRKKDHSRVIDIIANLAQFKYKYLRNNETFRSQCFIRLLEVLVKSNFHQVRSAYLAEPILKKMASKETVIDQENVFAEILPLEHIWQLIIQLL